MIQPLNGPQLWSKTRLLPPLPPVYHKPPGRPPTFRRKRLDEPTKPTKVTRENTTVKRGNCGTWGHNYRTCKNPPNMEYQQKNKNKPRWKSLDYKRERVSAYFVVNVLN
ncbi:hypothetical protein ACSBR1_013118 [Camellia fascicularis]